MRLGAPDEGVGEGRVSMDRVTEAILAFIATAEMERTPWLLSMKDDPGNGHRVIELLRDGYIQEDGDTLIASSKGWHLLDTRPG